LEHRPSAGLFFDFRISMRGHVRKHWRGVTRQANPARSSGVRAEQSPGDNIIAAYRIDAGRE
jgi:hypothetical protein